MVNGLDKFRDTFRNFNDQYVIIGGTACDMAMEEAGLEFRVTKDLDVVLQIEALNKGFVESFWQFINEGQYIIQQNSKGKNNYYRFMQPKQPDYPFMIELFSRKPDSLTLEDNAHLTPIPTDEELSSLSAILLDDDYYTFLHAGKQIIDNISVLRPEHLIPLKARAWIDLTERRKKGASIDSRVIRKHKNDVFRVYQIIEPDYKFTIPASIKQDLRVFIKSMRTESINLKSFGLAQVDLTELLDELESLYGII
ncbi:MAG: hypothetical protein DRP58_01020 [Spirochaetes bacterium]|nr:MAG: hypothetical protein DRP58_01020 [Spirochaetota bacterium]